MHTNYLILLLAAGGIIYWQLERCEERIFENRNFTGSRNMKFITDFGMICYMFALGLEMNPTLLLQLPTREAIYANVGMLTTFILACCTTPFLQYASPKVTSKVFILALAMIMSSTGSPLLTRVLTDLKIGKSDIGQLAVAAAVHSELVATIVISIGYAIFLPENNFELRRRNMDHKKYFTKHAGIHIGISLAVQVIIAAGVGPIVMSRINCANPQGKALKGSHLVLSIAFVVVIGSISPFVGFSPVLSAFVTGVFLPRDGRISRFMISKVNYFLSFIFYPYFFVWVGLEAEFSKFEAGSLGCWARLFSFFIIGTVGKIVGAIVCGLIFAFNWQESIALGLLLNIKGHLHMYLAIIAMKNKIISNSTCIEMILSMMLMIVYVPLVGLYIIERARKLSPKQRMALQWHDHSQKLRILLCLHGPQNVPAAASFIEISQGVADPGIVVYATDMIQLTDEIATTISPGEGVAAVTITDNSVIQMRQQITTALQEYVRENVVGVILHRMLALSTFANMHQDISTLASNSLISLVVLPFHKSLQSDGTMDGGHAGFRYVNRKMLRTAPCSVAILVDRGLGSMTQISKPGVSLNVAVIFIGGKDDREALAYASRAAHHPDVKLTVVRFLLDTDAEGSSALAGRARVRVEEQEEEMKLDDECFADFYERHIARGRVSYSEKHLVNSAQAYSTLQSLEGQYGLFIVGRGGRVNSVLTVGMNDLEKCPELGPLGDILSGPNFSSTASVLIIQQHTQRAELGGADN
ncbi:hypothetical protein Nepgr_022451 [Nepenthes gracilis]|uniref:Cation/H+ exchanger domain-containing protein n=1 Tax=Nepenthes gracilis TaxID=150966 RepID=A0AAD3XY68_NEPGR|nr:hypothetical protein Nepgr_022451 [Nepenthes gracilis]